MQPQTLLDVRLYGGDSAHPSSFRGKGWRGLAIRFLNWIRYRIETLVQYLVLSSSFEDENGKVDEKAKLNAQSEFRVAVERERLYSRLQDPALATGVPSSPVDSGVLSREGRYVTRRGEKFVYEEEELVRPVPIDTLVSRLGSHGRDKKYGQSTLVMEDHLSGLEEEKKERD